MGAKALITTELAALVKEGAALITATPNDIGKAFVPFTTRYQAWYTKALRLLDVFARDRLAEFRGYYEVDPKRERLSAGNYAIHDFVSGITPTRDALTKKPNWSVRNILQFRIGAQHTILQSLKSRIDGVLASLEATLAAEVEDASLATAERLLKVSVRAAGALAGVILEDHLQRVAVGRSVNIGRKNPTVADLNEALKQSDVYDVATWRKVQYLADIRNVCVHKKDVEPTSEQAQELLTGTNWVVKNVG